MVEILTLLLTAMSQVLDLLGQTRATQVTFGNIVTKDLTSLQLAAQQMQDAVGTPCELQGEAFPTVW